MINLQRDYGSQGYLIIESDYDTTNLICRHGYIYADGDYLCASIQSATLSQAKALRKLGTPIMDGDEGELTVKFTPLAFRQVAKIMLPRLGQHLVSEK